MHPSHAIQSISLCRRLVSKFVDGELHSGGCRQHLQVNRLAGRMQAGSQAVRGAGEIKKEYALRMVD